MNETENKNNQLKNITRDKNGLIENFNYIYNEEGLVDWKSLLPSRFIYINNDPKRKEKIEEKYGKLYSEIDPVLDKVEDSDLIVTLAGLKYLLRIRGYHSMNFVIKEAKEDYAAISCQINFIGNFETENRDIIYSDCACAHFNNVTGFGKNYLVELASNRALARAIRSALNLNIVSREELNGNSVEVEVAPPSNNAQVEKLQKEMEDKKVIWEMLREKLNKKEEKERYPTLDLEKCKSEKDLPKEVIFDLITRMKRLPKK